LSDQKPPSLSLTGSDPDRQPSLADFVVARLSPAASAYWTALHPNLAIPFEDAYSTALGVTCHLLAERDDLIDSISRTSEGETGLMIGQKGDFKRHPLSTRLNQIEIQINSLLTEFAMTPAGLRKLQHAPVDASSRAASLMNLIN